jgi:uncharacterized membrane protein
MEQKRPRITIIPTTADKALEILAWAVLAGLWLYVILRYPSLPDIIPTHINGKGEIDGHGSKQTLWIIPGIATVLFVGITILNRYPHIFNYPTEITEENAPRIYRLATRMMRFMKLSTTLIFCIIVYDMTRRIDGSAPWILPLIMLISGVPLIWFLYKTFRNA